MLLVLTLTCLFQLTLAVVEPIVVKGSRFFYQNGTQFTVRAVDYYSDGRNTAQGQGVSDLLANLRTCQRDVPYFKGLGINVIVVDQFTLGAERAACMELLADADIYLLVKLNEVTTTNHLGTPQAIHDYTLLTWMESLIDEFHNYPNVLGVYLHVRTGAVDELPKFKGWAKHAKENFITGKGYRDIPLGISFANTMSAPEFARVGLDAIPQYFNCGEYHIDFYLANFLMTKIDWCVNSTMLTQYNYAETFRNYSIPTVLVYGCKKGAPHDFAEMDLIFADNTFAGGELRDYLDDTAGFASEVLGVVEAKAGSITPRSPYSTIASKLSELHPSPTLFSDYQPTLTPSPSCGSITWAWLSKAGPNKTVTSRGVSVTSLPVIASEKLCSCMMETLSCVSVSKNQLDDRIWHRFCPDDETPNDSCMGAYYNYTSGEYGTYAGCRYDQISSWALNQEYLKRGKDDAWCTGNNGTVKTPLKTQNNACKEFARQAGANSTGRITATPLPDLDAVAAQSENKLSTAAKAGLAVGVIVAALILLGLVLWFRLAAKRKARNKEELAKIEMTDLPPGELSTEAPNRYEMGVPASPKELAAEREAKELASDGQIHELYAGEILELSGSPTSLKHRNSAKAGVLHEEKPLQAVSAIESAPISAATTKSAISPDGLSPQPTPETHDKLQKSNISPVEGKETSPTGSVNNNGIKEPGDTRTKEEESKS